jgi:hypothetical protein
MEHWVDLDKNMIGGTCKARDFPAQIAYIRSILENNHRMNDSAR